MSRLWLQMISWPITRLAVTAGTGSKRSTPAITKTNARKSASVAARNSVPSDRRGSIPFAAIPAARCPTNMRLFGDAVLGAQPPQRLAIAPFFEIEFARGGKIVRRNGAHHAGDVRVDAPLHFADLVRHELPGVICFPSHTRRPHLEPVRQRSAPN